MTSAASAVAAVGTAVWQGLTPGERAQAFRGAGSTLGNAAQFGRNLARAGGSISTPERVRHASRGPAPRSNATSSGRTTAGRPHGWQGTRRPGYSGNTMTRFDKTKGRRGLKGKIRRVVSKKKASKQRKQYTRTIVQKYYLCNTDNFDTTLGRNAIRMRDYLTSEEAKSPKNASLVVMAIQNTETHWDPDYYKVGNQIIPNDPQFTNFAKAFLWTQTVSAGADGFIPLKGQNTIMSMNQIPETGQPLNLAGDPGRAYQIPNTILSGIDVNMSVGSDRPYAQTFSIKLIRSNDPVPVHAGSFANTHPQEIARIQEMCNRGGATNGKMYSTIWSHTGTIRANKCGTTARRTYISKKIKLDLVRSQWRRHSSAADAESIGTQMLPNFEFAGDGFFNQVYLVLSVYAKDDHYNTDVTYETASRLNHNPDPAFGTPGTGNPAVRTVTTESMRVRREMGYSRLHQPNVDGREPIDDATYLPGIGYPRFTFGGTVTVFHKCKEAHRGKVAPAVQLALHRLRVDAGLEPERAPTADVDILVE